jgi:N-acetylglucosamine-6-sulfatase
MRPGTTLGAGSVAWVVAMLAACGGGSPAAPVPAQTPPPRLRPNLIVVVADDLDVPTASEMPRLPELLANQGLSFTRAYVPMPLCAPSRASFLTGQYSHNHTVLGNRGPDGGFPAFRRHEQATVATWLRSVGYRTSLVGKYMNDYPRGAADDYVPPGWDDWFGHMSSLEDGRYYNYWVNDNGSTSRFGGNTEDYSVDVETARALRFIRDAVNRPEPFFLFLGPEAPHEPAHYAERFRDEFRYSFAPRSPSFNESDVRDKPYWIRQIPYLTDEAIDWTDKYQRSRLRTLRAVEEMIASIQQALAEAGVVDRTYIFFTSDNGLLMGQHRVVGLKGNPYEESIRIPFMVRGPGVPVGTVEQPVLNIDLAPTLLDLAGASVPDTVDGRSLAPFLGGASPSSWRNDVLIETLGADGRSSALRTVDWLYNHMDTDELELYDMRQDPFQLRSLHREADPALLEKFEQRIKTLLACRGASCR